MAAVLDVPSVTAVALQPWMIALLGALWIVAGISGRDLVSAHSDDDEQLLV